MKLNLDEIDDIIVNLKSYTTTSIDIVKLEAIERTSSFIANFISGLIIGMIVLLFAIFASLGIGIYLSELLSNYYLGFGMVSTAYLIIGIFLIIGRKTLINKPIQNRIIQGLCPRQVNKDQYEQ